MITPKGWSSSGSVRIVELPYAVGWAAHHLVGAALLEQGKAEQAVQCAREPIQVKPGTRHAVFEIGRLTDWPVHLGDSNEAWESLRRLSEQLRWISTDFGEADEYRAATVAHALALNFTEFLARVQNGPNFEVVRQDREHAPRIPLYFWNEDTETQRRAFRMLLRDSTGLRAALDLLARIPNLVDRWEEWIRYQQSWVSLSPTEPQRARHPKEGIQCRPDPQSKRGPCLGSARHPWTDSRKPALARGHGLLSARPAGRAVACPTPPLRRR